jgi:glyoxylase-like metal-dependent hydrolase (beta-lactamase superfamily II)
MQVGNCRITSIVEADRVSYPMHLFFENFDLALARAQYHLLAPDFVDAETDETLIEMKCWLVETPRHKILIDSGIGNHKERNGDPLFHHLETPWLAKLTAAGARPKDIDFVVHTHLHVDHCGWNTILSNGEWVPTFQNAKYLFSKTERDFWAQELQGLPLPPHSDYNKGVFTDSVLPIIKAGQALVFDGSIEFADCMAMFPTPGHTPGHCAVVMRSGGFGAVFAGDTLHHPLQVLYPDWNGGGGGDSLTLRRSRRAVLGLAADEGLLLAPTHFRGKQLCQVYRCNDGFRYEWVA